MKLHFVLADTWRTYMAEAYSGEHHPYKKRIVTIELTPEQIKAVKPRKVGTNGGEPVYEDLLEIIPEEEE